MREDEGLRRATQAISFLVSSSYAVSLFPVKWRCIREKLEQLYSMLTAAGGEREELTQFLEGVASTAEEAQELVGRCRNLGSSGGKLRLRSDVDLLAASVDLHIKKLNGLHSSGTLSATSSRALVISRPAAGAGHEEMRFYMKDLLTRIRIGDSEMKSGALAAINEVLCEEKYMGILAAEELDGIGLLARSLETGEPEIVEGAAEALSAIAGFQSGKAALARSGVVPPLVRVLETGSELGREKAARALMKMTENGDNAWSVSAHGGVNALLRVSGDLPTNPYLVSLAAKTLRNLSAVSEVKRFMVDAGIVSILVNLSKSKNESVSVQAIEFLHSLSSENEIIRRDAVELGIMESLSDILDPSSNRSPKAREIALLAADGFCSSTAFPIPGLLDRLLFFLKNGEVPIQESALKLASRLSGTSQETKKAMTDMGFMPELVRMFEAKSYEVRATAAEALSGLISVQRNRRKFIHEDHNVDRILRLIDPLQEKSAMNRSLLPLVMSLTESSSGRKKIVASGYLKNLQKLAETDADQAKCIIRKLSGNRFINIITRIWAP